MSNPYAANKAILHVGRLKAIKEGRVPSPVHVHFIISDLCNQDCSFCAYRIDGYTEFFAVKSPSGEVVNHNPNRMIEQSKTMEILTDLSDMGVKAVQFTGGGEPTVHPQCSEIMAFALKLGLETALVTNGVLLHKVFEEAVRSTWVRISIDAGTADTYAKVRRVPANHYEKVLGNVHALVNERNRRGLPVTIGIGFVVNKDNWHEIKAGVAVAKDLGVDNIRLSAVFQPDGARHFKDFQRQADSDCADAESESTGAFTVINNFQARLGDLWLGHPDYGRCPHQQLVTYIGADLNVYRCCVLSYTERGKIGTLNGMTFKDLWTSDNVIADFAGFDAHGCPRCQFNDKNYAMNEMIDGLPTQHGNFV